MEDKHYITLEIKNGILYGKYIQPVINYDIAKRAVLIRKNFVQNSSLPSLVDCRNVNKFEKQARDYLSTDEANNGVTAGAILINSSFQAAIANFFLKVAVPKIPARLFTSEEKALEWLQQFIK